MKEFPPDRQRGLVILFASAIGLSLISLLGAWLTFQTQVGLLFAVYILIFIVTAIPAPFLWYRAYALNRANYLLDRNTLRLVWGLRVEDIPVNDVEWVRPADSLPVPVSLPWFRLPGGIVGIVHQPRLGKVEFMAADTANMVLVATARQVYAISPENPPEFLAAFHKTIEMGSLHSAQSQSQYPSFVVNRAWELPLVRFLWVSGAILNTGLLVWITLFIPNMRKVSLGFDALGNPLAPVAGEQLILLPILSAFLFMVGMLIGLFFFRKQEDRILALVVWASGTFSTLLFLIAAYFILAVRV